MHVSTNILLPTTEKVGDWRKMHDEELLFVLLAKYYPGDQIKQNEMIGTCDT
jgi:hypothetical protein